MGMFDWASLDLGQRWRKAAASQDERRRSEALDRDRLDIELLRKNAAPKVLTVVDRFNDAVRSGDLVTVRALLQRNEAGLGSLNPDVLLSGPIPEGDPMVGTPDALDGASGWFLIPNVGAIARERTKVGYTALMWAMATSNLTLADLLIEAGAKPSTPNDERRTPLSVAAKAQSIKALLWIAPHVNQREWTREDGDLAPRAYVERFDPVLAQALDQVVKPLVKPVIKPASPAVDPLVSTSDTSGRPK